MNGGRKYPVPKPLKWEAGLREYAVNKDGTAGDRITFGAGQIQAAIGYLREKIREKVKDGESRKAALDAVDEAFPDFMPA